MRPSGSEGAGNGYDGYGGYSRRPSGSEGAEGSRFLLLSPHHKKNLSPQRRARTQADRASMPVQHMYVCMYVCIYI